MWHAEATNSEQIQLSNLHDFLLLLLSLSLRPKALGLGVLWEISHGAAIVNDKDYISLLKT